MAITRADSTSTAPVGALVRKVDYNDQASLVEALRGQDALVITMAARAPPEQQMKLIEAAATAKVPWVLPNEYGYDNSHPGLLNDIPLGKAHAAHRAHIEELGVSAWVGITCGFWYEYSLPFGPCTYGFDLPNRTVTFFDDGNTRINTSTLPQCGRAVARLLGLKILPDDGGDRTPCLSHYRNRFVYVSSFKISQREMLDSILRVTGTEMRDWKISHEDSVSVTSIPPSSSLPHPPGATSSPPPPYSPSPLQTPNPPLPPLSIASIHFQLTHRQSTRYRAGLSDMQKGGTNALTGYAQLMYSRVFYPNGGGDFEASRGLQNGVLGFPVEGLDGWTGVAVGKV